MAKLEPVPAGDAPAVRAAARAPSAVLDLHLGEMRQICNAMDPAPFRERDLDPNAEDYIVGWGRETRSGEPLGLVGKASYGGIIKESFVIGGWVALWRPLEIFLYDWWPIRAEAQLFDRLGEMDVRLLGAPPATAGSGAAP
jgi:hypothetical protein